MLKINFLGDSITEGAAASKEENTFVCLLAKMNNAVVRNYGIGGTRIARAQYPSEDPRYDLYFASRVEAMDKDADYVFVFGGTNDYGHGSAPFGKMGDKTVDTFYGAVDYLINELLKYYKKEQLVFMPPLYRIDEVSCNIHPLSDFRIAMKEVVDSYGIKYLDLKDKIGPAKDNPYIADGLHPNDKGHHLLAELITDYIQNVLLKSHR